MDTIIRWCNRVNPQTEEEVRIIRFGASLLLENVTRLLLLLVLGIFVGEGKETAIFLIVFCSIRLQVGGYHAQTGLGCMGCMLIAWGIALLGSKMSITFFYKIIFTVLCLSVIVITAPRTSNRKYYTQRIILEKKIKASILVIFFIAISFISKKHTSLIVCSIVLEVITLLFHNKKTEE